VISVLADRSRSVIASPDYYGQTPLHLACHFGGWRYQVDKTANYQICKKLRKKDKKERSMDLYLKLIILERRR
jgi:hypothetical protein